MKLFYTFSSINWGRVSIIIASATAFWLGMVSIIPEKYHHAGTVLLGAISAAITVLMRGGTPSVSESIKDNVVEKLEQH